ncbi:MAG: hypothetical protein K2H53_05090 [Clostridia bacterium]|nr:hypothetical protein [Clostridia bacterium]
MICDFEKDLMMLFSRPEICGPCKGRCCKRNACDCLPLNFNNDINKMEEALKTGNYAIDFARRTADAFIWKGEYRTLDIEHILSTDTEVLYIRPRNKSRPIVDIIHSKNDEGPCVFWSYEKGCELSYEQRPIFGRTTIPNENHYPCLSYYDLFGSARSEMCTEWKPYVKDLFKLTQHFFDEEWSLYKDFKINLKVTNIG